MFLSRVQITCRGLVAGLTAVALLATGLALLAAFTLIAEAHSPENHIDRNLGDITDQEGSKWVWPWLTGSSPDRQSCILFGLTEDKTVGIRFAKLERPGKVYIYDRNTEAEIHNADLTQATGPKWHTAFKTVLTGSDFKITEYLACVEADSSNWTSARDQYAFRVFVKEPTTDEVTTQLVEQFGPDVEGGEHCPNTAHSFSACIAHLDQTFEGRIAYLSPGRAQKEWIYFDGTPGTEYLVKLTGHTRVDRRFEFQYADATPCWRDNRSLDFPHLQTDPNMPWNEDPNHSCTHFERLGYSSYGHTYTTVKMGGIYDGNGEQIARSAREGSGPKYAARRRVTAPASGGFYVQVQFIGYNYMFGPYQLTVTEVD